MLVRVVASFVALLSLSAVVQLVPSAEAQTGGEVVDAPLDSEPTRYVDDEGVSPLRERESFSASGFTGRALAVREETGEVRGRMTISYQPPNGTGSDFAIIAACEDITRGSDYCFNRTRWDPSGSHSALTVQSRDGNQCVFDSRDGDPFYSRAEVWRGVELQAVGEGNNRVLPYQCR